MTKTINDNVQVDCIIDGNNWLVEEAEVSRTKASTPDYVKMIVGPDKSADYEIPDPTKIDELIGTEFTLTANNELISERDASEDSLLFTGKLARISPLGDGFYDATAYDESQQAFEGISPEQKTGSVLNTVVYVPMPETSYESINSRFTGTKYKKRTIKAKKLVTIILEAIGVTDYQIDLVEGGKTVSGENGSYTGAYNYELLLSSPYVTAEKGLKLARNMTLSDWWFDKEGVFHFGLPEPTKHELKYIIEADDGKTTPPYQSVKVIGSGIASEEGYTRATMQNEDEITFAANIGEDGSGAFKLDKVDPENTEELIEPTYTFKSAEITTDAQAKSTAKKFLEDLAEQQADGEIKVVGYPEIEIFDGIKMPQTERQPMGGYAYGVYEVVHRLNSSDGFISIVKVGKPVAATKNVVSEDVPQPAEEPPTEEDVPSDSGESSSSGSDSSSDSYPAESIYNQPSRSPSVEESSNDSSDSDENSYPAQNIYNQ